MVNNLNFEAEERKAGSKAATTLKNDFRSQLKRHFHKRSGNLEKSTVLARYKEGRLDRLALNSPRYSFQTHFGSTKTGTQKATTRDATKVKSFQRHVKGKKQEVEAHNRTFSTVKAFNKKRRYRATNHIAKALQTTKALETLATDLGNNRVVLITSQIQF